MLLTKTTDTSTISGSRFWRFSTLVILALSERELGYPSSRSYILRAKGFGVTSGSIINGWFVQALPIDKIKVFTGFHEESVL